jgi:RNA ligase (TIGR02306 family)
MKLAVIGGVHTTKPIPGADRIHQAVVDCGDAGVWTGVVTKDIDTGHKVVVFLQDALLQPGPRWDFMEKSKWRVRMARFKGVPSECLIVPAVGHEDLLPIGADLTELLGVTKYEKPIPVQMAGEVRGNFPSFIPKTDEENFQRLRDLQELMHGSDWVATVKYDGTSCTVWNDEDGMHVCSRNLELKEFSESGKGNVYWQVARKFELDRLPHGIAIQFEIVGPGIQGNPCGYDDLQMALFTAYDISRMERMHFGSLTHLSQGFDLPMAEIVASGFGHIDEETLRTMADSAVYQNGAQAEGVVVRDIRSLWSFKAISLNYKD